MRKYRNKKVRYKGMLFDSIREMKRYMELEILERVGEIQELEIHTKYVLQKSFKYRNETIRAITYSADFRYIQNGKIYVEDVKGGEATKTNEYKVKKKIFLKLYGENIIFLEI